MLEYLDKRASLATTAIDPTLEPVAAYLVAWRAREGTLLSAPAASTLPKEYVAELDERLSVLLEQVDLPAEIIGRHPGVSAVSLQGLLNYFRGRTKPIEELPPSSPESDDAHSQLVAVFHDRVNPARWRWRGCFGQPSSNLRSWS
jgi:hypothetical protein